MNTCIETGRVMRSESTHPLSSSSVVGDAASLRETPESPTGASAVIGLYR
jgi:hypothetical protein